MNTVYVVELDYPLKNPNDSVWIVGSCNGLLCLAIEGDPIFWWDPYLLDSLGDGQIQVIVKGQILGKGFKLFHMLFLWTIRVNLQMGPSIGLLLAILIRVLCIHGDTLLLI
ncbi:hypothetical protein LguiA_030137 [Lonicera macranthoides]